MAKEMTKIKLKNMLFKIYKSFKHAFYEIFYLKIILSFIYKIN